ncbi:MAG: hypothetical protein P857_1087 [Candidatus Xenolissoclinum pacificiensis L6]|uniref:Glutamine amidotransferase class-I family protein n=1 Tax=Candidatus Xenolissoclinum pacificiensis L6 TaxID=1401685 RepID=W2V2M0_9RICK|nr:MAG: hypothetical protein P857_1087 [Candidatus Xenolissoclinum pacificiensis L6]
MTSMKKCAGVITTNHPVTEHEMLGSQNMIQALNKLGFDIHIIDYNIISHDFSNQTLLYNKVFKIIKYHNITTFIIPGYFYNISSPPLYPSGRRQLLIYVILKMCYQLHIRIIGVCGGLQGVLSLQGIQPQRLSTFNIPAEIQAKEHGICNILDLSFLTPNSVVQKITNHEKEYKMKNIYIPHINYEGIINNASNHIKLSALHYKILALSSNKRVISIVYNMKYPILLFQGHPEGLIMNLDNHKITDYRIIESIKIVTKLFLDHLGV